MNFFKSVFSDDPDPSDESEEEKPLSDSPRKRREDEEGGEETHAATEDDQSPSYKTNLKPNIPWAGLGTLIKTFASKSESVIQTYRRDLEEFSSGLKKETEAICEVASRAVRDLPLSLEAGASAAQESLETVGQVIDDFGGSVWRGTAEIISEGKDALLAVDSDAETHSSEHHQTPLSGGVAASSSKRYSRFEVQVLAMQSDPSTFLDAPEDEEDFRKWMSEFKLDEKEEEVEILCYDNGTLEGIFEQLVPSVVDYETFWSRYYYKLYKLKQAEDVRANLVKRVISREEEDDDLTWDVDDDEEERKEVKDSERDDERTRIGDIREENGAKVVNKVESKSEDVEEGKEMSLENRAVSNSEPGEEINVKGDVEEDKWMGLENREVSHSEPVEEHKEEGDAKVIEVENGKEPVGEPEAMSLEVAAAVVDEIVASSSEEVDDPKPANDNLITNSADNTLLKASSEIVEPLLDSDMTIVSRQTSMPEEEDLGWDEIEDLGEHDGKKIGDSSSTVNRKLLHSRVNLAEDDDDLTWDIEDDD